MLTSGAKADAAAGAKAFATYFVQAVDWGLATTDPYLISAISAPSCRACAGYIQGLLHGKKFQRTTYALDRASREAALARLFEQSVSSETHEEGERLAA